MKSSIETSDLQTAIAANCTSQVIAALILDATGGKVDIETEGSAAVVTPKKVSGGASLSLNKVGSKIIFTIAVHNGQVAATITNDPEVLARWVVKFINLL